MTTRDPVQALQALTPAQRATLPVHERVLDGLADLLFDTDELLGMLEGEEAGTMRWIAPRIRAVYEQVNQLMKQLAD